jgi:hypothetical protein
MIVGAWLWFMGTEEVYTESSLKPKQVTRTIGDTAHAYLPASTVTFFYKEIDGEIRIFVIKTAILTKLSRWFAVSF